MRERMSATLDDLDRRLLWALQDDLPLRERPFAVLAARLGVNEDEVLQRLRRYLAEGIVTRFGPFFQVERMGGAFCLAAMAVPEERFEEVAATVGAFPQVAHNYRREHALNMWFVLAATRPEGIAEVAWAIEDAVSLRVWLFPKEREYFVRLRLRP
ncbi:MAG: AsnC family transcriptional regulator [Rhodocyclales bacterium]|nr:AsnC family transcriptional regulator [Rhodocyclales bacterium]